MGIQTSVMSNPQKESGGAHIDMRKAKRSNRGENTSKRKEGMGHSSLNFGKRKKIVRVGGESKKGKVGYETREDSDADNKKKWDRRPLEKTLWTEEKQQPFVLLEEVQKKKLNAGGEKWETWGSAQIRKNLL